MKNDLQFEATETPLRRGERPPVPPRRVTLPGMFGRPLSLVGVAPSTEASLGTVGLPRLSDRSFRTRGKTKAK